MLTNTRLLLNSYMILKVKRTQQAATATAAAAEVATAAAT